VASADKPRTGERPPEESAASDASVKELTDRLNALQQQIDALGKNRKE